LCRGNRACIGNVNRDIDITVLCRACIGNVNRDVDITDWCRACIGNVNRDVDIPTDIGVWQLGVFSNTIPNIFF